MYDNIEMSSKENINVEKLFQLKVIDFINYIKNCTEEQLKMILQKKETVVNIPINLFNIFVLNSPLNIKEILFSDKQYLQKVLQIPKNRFGKSFFELLSKEEKREFIKNKKILDEIDKKLFIEYTGLLNLDEIDEFEEILTTILTDSDYQIFLDKIQQRFKINSNLYQNIMSKLSNGKRNILKYLKLNNEYELFIYNKFNLVLKVNMYDDKEEILCFDNCHIVSKKYLENINEKHMNLIIKKMLEMNNESKKINYTKIFITSVKMYEVFGFDNTLKILNNKFTFMNTNTLKKFARIDYIDQRRQYRLENQERFYSYEMLQKTKKALREKDLYFFCSICKDCKDEYLIDFFGKLEYEIKNNPNSSEDDIITNMIQTEIKQREDYLENEYVQQYCNKFNNKQMLGRQPIAYEELYKMFKDIDIKPIFDEKGRVIPNEQLTKFLLGNEKQDNDCLFRLILNKNAFGLNQNLSTLINSFEEIKKIATRKTNTFSLYSILDVIDICKSTLYNLAPNEQDMTLETVTKIQNATQYCSEPKEHILLRAKKLHVERRKKVCSSIPSVEGKTNKNIRYKVLNFDYDAFITCGIDTGSCLRVGGLGEDFLRYCMTNPHAVIIGMWDENNKFYICPYIRNGNGIYGNGIDPKPETEEKSQALLEALQLCTSKIIKESSSKEKIEFATITDLNQKTFLENMKLRKIDINCYLPLDEHFYSDYHKENKTTYIISSIKGLKEQRFYKPKKRYYQPRIPNYVYNTDMEKDKERIELLINSIKYSSIDFKTKLKQGEKNTEKRRFKKLKIEEFEYIIGNKDWFIAIDNCLNIISCHLPYDPRSAQEYMEAFISLKEKYNINPERKLS